MASPSPPPARRLAGVLPRVRARAYAPVRVRLRVRLRVCVRASVRGQFGNCAGWFGWVRRGAGIEDVRDDWDWGAWRWTPGDSGGGGAGKSLGNHPRINDRGRGRVELPWDSGGSGRGIRAGAGRLVAGHRHRTDGGGCAGGRSGRLVGWSVVARTGWYGSFGSIGGVKPVGTVRSVRLRTPEPD
ncbi:MAG TPA: hypothetical protein VLH56_08450 [Dissulfurispiraceae bacterium]|nr:hypothetical protein [Dissulfurispiraceae bacterium]